MRPAQPEPLGALADQMGRHWIWLHCNCGRGTKHNPADLAEQFGPNLPLRHLTSRARCRACGARGATLTIQPPYLRDGSDAIPRTPSPLA
jgi:hypothetical protein